MFSAPAAVFLGYPSQSIASRRLLLAAVPLCTLVVAFSFFRLLPLRPCCVSIIPFSLSRSSSGLSASIGLLFFSRLGCAASSYCSPGAHATVPPTFWDLPSSSAAITASPLLGSSPSAGGVCFSALLTALRFCCAFLTHCRCRRFSFLFHLLSLVGSHLSIFGASAAWPSLLFFSLGLPWCWSSMPFCKVMASAAAYYLAPFRRLFLYTRVSYWLLSFGIWPSVFRPLSMTLVSCRLSLSFCFTGPWIVCAIVS